MNTMWKDCKVHAIRVSDNTSLYGVVVRDTVSGDWFAPKKVSSTHPIGENHHLYITSDNEIKDGDYCLYAGNGSIEQAINDEDGSERWKKYGWRKIIASTDNSERLKVRDFIGYIPIPQIPKQFIKDWIDNSVEDVEVEYEDGSIRCDGYLALLGGDGESGEGMEEPLYCRCERCGETGFYPVEIDSKCKMITKYQQDRLQINPDNTINVRFKEQVVVTNNEALEIIRRFKNHCNIVGYPSDSFKKKVKKWVKENGTYHK